MDCQVPFAAAFPFVFIQHGQPEKRGEKFAYVFVMISTHPDVVQVAVGIAELPYALEDFLLGARDTLQIRTLKRIAVDDEVLGNPEGVECGMQGTGLADARTEMNVRYDERVNPGPVGALRLSQGRAVVDKSPMAQTVLLMEEREPVHEMPFMKVSLYRV